MNLEHIKLLHPKGVNRPTVLLVHGACMGAWVWQDNFLSYLFEKGFNVSAISLRYHAGSSNEGSLRGTSIKNYVDDMKQIVEELTGDVFIIGHSMGGFTIQHYLNNVSTRVKGVVLLCSVPNTGLWKLIPKLVWDYPFHFLFSCLKMSWLPIINNESRLKKLMFSKTYPLNKVKKVNSFLQDESFLAFLEMSFLRLPKLSASPVPMMVVGAADDYLISEASTRRMATYFGVEPLIIKDAAHCFMLEPGWEKVADEVVGFFNGLLPRASQPLH